MSTFLSATGLSLRECRNGLTELEHLLQSEKLSEKTDIRPFFKKWPQLIVLAGEVMLPGCTVDRIADEVKLFGWFQCDWVVGDARRSPPCYALIEFENALSNSVFSSKGKRHPEWASRLEHGFSQLVDWSWILDHRTADPDFLRLFDSSSALFSLLLVIGRDHFLDHDQQARLAWRSSHIAVNSHKVECITFDELYRRMQRRLTLMERIARELSSGPVSDAAPVGRGG